MDKFGKRPFRDPYSSGTSGLLGEGSTVFYSSLFGSQGVGRVSDLICAALSKKLPGKGVDELRLRAVLLFTFFEAWRAQAATRGASAPASITLEAGFDDEKIAVGIGFAHAGPRLDGLVDRIADGEPRDLFEALLAQIHDEADRTYLKIDPVIQRVEVVSLLAIQGKIDRAQLDEVVDVVILERQPGMSRATMPPKSELIELGDLGYDELLRENGPGSKKHAAFSGEILAQHSGEATELKDALVARVQGSGGAEIVNNEVIRIAGVTQKIGGDEAIVVRGEETPKETEEEIVEEEEVAEEALVVPGAEQVKKFFRRVWPFKKRPDEEAAEAVVVVSGTPSAPEAVQVVSGEPAAEEEEVIVVEEPAPEPAVPATTATTVSGTAESAAESLLIEIKEGSLDFTISKAQREASEIKKELQSGKAKRWVDGLMGELVREKSRLHEIAQKLNVQVRQKQLEFRNRQNALEEELRRREEMLRQKNNALNRTKEQLAQLQLSNERLKNATAESEQEDAEYKSKYQMTQKILSNVKDENAALAKKLDEAKSQLASAMQGSARGRDSGADLANQQKAERLQRQVDEFKRVNQQLMEKLGDASRKSAASGPGTAEDMRKRLELASRVSFVHQKEAEQLRLRVEELQREEMRLKAELARATVEAKASKSGGGGKAA